MKKKVLLSEQNEAYRNNVRKATNEEARYEAIVETLRRRMYRINKKIWESVDEDENDNIVVKLRDDIEEKVNILPAKEAFRRKKLLDDVLQEFTTKIKRIIKIVGREEKNVVSNDKKDENVEDANNADDKGSTEEEDNAEEQQEDSA